MEYTTTIDEMQEKANKLKSTLLEVEGLISSLGCGKIINAERIRHGLKPLYDAGCNEILVKRDCKWSQLMDKPIITY